MAFRPDNPSFRISPGKGRDIEPLSRLYDRLNDHLAETVNHAGWIKGIYPTAETALNAVLEQSLYVATLDDVIVGSIVLNHVPEPAYAKAQWPTEGSYDEMLVVRTLVVDPNYMQQGIALAMLEFARNLAIDSGFKALRLDVFENNTPAIALYKKADYRYVGTVDLELNIPGLEYFELYELSL